MQRQEEQATRAERKPLKNKAVLLRKKTHLGHSFSSYDKERRAGSIRARHMCEKTGLKTMREREPVSVRERCKIRSSSPLPGEIVRGLLLAHMHRFGLSSSSKVARAPVRTMKREYRSLASSSYLFALLNVTLSSAIRANVTLCILRLYHSLKARKMTEVGNGDKASLADDDVSSFSSSSPSSSIELPSKMSFSATSSNFSGKHSLSEFAFTSLQANSPSSVSPSAHSQASKCEALGCRRKIERLLAQRGVQRNPLSKREKGREKSDEQFLKRPKKDQTRAVERKNSRFLSLAGHTLARTQRVRPAVLLCGR